MVFKGIIKICKGIFSENTLTFEDADVSPAVSLSRLAEDYHSGLDLIPLGKEITIRADKQMINFTELNIQGTLVIEGDLWLA